MKTLFTLFLLILCSCQSRPKETLVAVDISEGMLTVFDGRKAIEKMPVHTSRRGIGHKSGSGRTPTGQYTLTKEPHHRYGPVLRLSGYQGYRRGILLHKELGSPGTRGCICPEEEDMLTLFNHVENGDTLLIEP